jgi:hypothetical protein
MQRLIALAAAAVLTLSDNAVAQAPAGQLTPEQAEKARELAMKGHALFTLLKEPSRCGAPAPKGYVCALVLYKDVSEDRNRDRLPKLLTARVTGITDAEGLPRDAKVRVLSPFDASPRTFSPMEMTRLRLSISSEKRAAEMATLEMVSVLGYAENAGLPAGDPRKIDPKRFKLPR